MLFRSAKKQQQIGQPLTGHTRSVTSVAFSPNGKQIVSGSDHKTICIWDAEPLQKISTLTCEKSITTHPIFSHHGYLFPSYIISDDHWVLGINHEHLFWIPSHLFNLFPHPFLLGIMGSSMHAFDDSDFVYGEQWEKCMSSS